MVASFTADDLWILATCACCAAACSLPGVFLMLRRSSMLGDAISHAILPGLALAFMISGSKSPWAMLLGALVAGLLTAFLSSLLHGSRLVKEDSSLGIVFTTFFAIGVIAIGIVARHVDLDPGCVLYGLAEFTPFDTVDILGHALPRSFVWLGVVLSINATLIFLFFKELKISTFDPGLARSLGFNTHFIHYGLMACLTVTAVAAFEAVGSILVVSMIITPAAAAYLLSDRLERIVLLAPLLGILSAWFGYIGALHLNTSVAGMMSVAAGGVFFTALICSPWHGVLRTIFLQCATRLHIIRDDMLGMLYRWHEVTGLEERNPLTRSDLFKAFGYSPLPFLAIGSLRMKGEAVSMKDGTLRLTERGKVEGAALVRSHRLWETYLATHLGLPLDHLHAPSERTEHFIGRALARDIEGQIEGESDPHGRLIPKG